MYNDIIRLISTISSVDELGDTTLAQTEKLVFCAVKSVSQSEHYQAASTGLKPEYKFVLSDYLDYDGQQKVKYNDVTYNVLRTFRTGNQLEIVVYGENQ